MAEEKRVTRRRTRPDPSQSCSPRITPQTVRRRRETSGRGTEPKARLTARRYTRTGRGWSSKSWKCRCVRFVSSRLIDFRSSVSGRRRRRRGDHIIAMIDSSSSSFGIRVTRASRARTRVAKKYPRMNARSRVGFAACAIARVDAETSRKKSPKRRCTRSRVSRRRVEKKAFDINQNTDSSRVSWVCPRAARTGEARGS